MPNAGGTGGDWPGPPEGKLGVTLGSDAGGKKGVVVGDPGTETGVSVEVLVTVTVTVKVDVAVIDFVAVDVKVGELFAVGSVVGVEVAVSIAS